MKKICHTGGTWGRVGYLPPGSLLCPARAGVQSEPIGWSDSNPLPGTPPPGTAAAADVYGKIPGKFGPPRGGQGGGSSPLPPRPTPHWIWWCFSSDPAATPKSALWACHPSPLLLLKCWPRPRCPPLEFFQGHPDRRVARLTDHTYRLPRVRPEADPFEEAGEDVERPCSLSSWVDGTRPSST